MERRSDGHESGHAGAATRRHLVSNSVFFASADDLRAWFAMHYDSSRELWMGFYTKD
jgi:hypothetical protein